jgi:hypothetical protein
LRIGRLGSFGSGADCLDALGGAALIASGGIFLDDAPFGGAVDEREGLRQDGFGGGAFLLVDQAADRPDLVAQPGPAHLIDFSAVLGGTDALNR